MKYAMIETANSDYLARKFEEYQDEEFLEFIETYVSEGQMVMILDEYKLAELQDAGEDIIIEESE